jgi:hypothetical protein
MNTKINDEAQKSFELYLKTLSKLQAGKARSHLKDEIVYEGMIYTKFQLAVYLLLEGYKPSIYLSPDWSKIEKSKERLQQIKNKYLLGFTNENLPIIKEAREIEKALENKEYIKKTYIFDVGPNTLIRISKTMHDYAVFLEQQQETQNQEIEK